MKQLYRNLNLCLGFLLWLKVTASVSVEELSHWSSWSRWSKCPSECGPAISVRRRQCRNNASGRISTPTNCPGDYTQRRLCQGTPCPESKPSPRQMACSKYDRRTFSGKQYIWEPFMHMTDPCKLSCRAKGAQFYANLAERVKDGVECGKNGILAVCIRGVCQPVGCDGIVLSNSHRDKCGLCKGEGSTCKTISGIFTSTQLTRGLNHVLNIPSGATNINITEMMPSRNLLVLQNVVGKAFINGDHGTPMTSDIQAAGTVFKYSAKTSINTRESILADGPTNVNLILKVLSRGSNPAIIYTFSVPHNVSDSYIKQITSHSSNPLSVQKAPIYLEDKNTPKSEPLAQNVNNIDKIPLPIDESEGKETEDNAVDNDNNNDLGVSEKPHSFPENAIDSLSNDDKRYSQNASQLTNTKTNSSQSISKSDSSDIESNSGNSGNTYEERKDLGQVFDFSEVIDNASKELDEKISESNDRSEDKEIIHTAESINMSGKHKSEESNQSGRVSSSENERKFDDSGILKEFNASRTVSGTVAEDLSSFEPTTAYRSQYGSRNGRINGLKGYPKSTTEEPERSVTSETKSKAYKIPRYSQSFTDRYRNRGRRRSRTQNSRIPDLTSREYSRPEDKYDFVSGKRSGVRQPSSLTGKKSSRFRPINAQQPPYRHKAEPRGDLTSALESRERSSGRARTYYTQRRVSLRERQARIQARHRKLREQREEYNRRLRERHEAQLKRRYQRVHRNSSHSQNQRYTRYKSRPDSTNTFRARLSQVQTSTVANVSPSRLNVLSSQERGSLRHSVSGSRYTSREGSFPVKLIPRPIRVTTNDRIPKQELISRVSESDPFTENTTNPESLSSETYILTTPSPQILTTISLKSEITTASFTEEDDEIESSSGDVPVQETTPSSEIIKETSTALKTRRVIARIRAPESIQSSVFSRSQPPATLPRENKVPAVHSQYIIPSTKTNNENVIPNTKLGGQDYPPNLIPNRRPPPNEIIGYTSYEWRISGLTECTHSCGGGFQQTVIVCVAERTQAVVTDENCADVQKPEIKAVTCNKRPCPAQWVSSAWSSCSVTCGIGQRTRTLFCQARVSPTLNLTMSLTSCEHLEKPEETQACDMKPCNSWTVGNWSECSANCGDGVKSRSVQCLDLNKQAVADDQCPDLKPKDELECNLGTCGKGWFVTAWPKECPAECGIGQLTRKVFCASDEGEALPESRCDVSQRPRIRKPCRVDRPCGGSWYAGRWSKCNSTCGPGSKIRDILCVKKLPGNVFAVVEEENCLSVEKPKQIEPCTLPNCEPEWYMTSWGQCSKTCDTGYRTRELKCLSLQQDPSDKCSLKERPKTRETCNTESCENISSSDDLSSESGASCEDKFVQCRIVKRARLCRYRYYTKMCCKSCQGQS